MSTDNPLISGQAANPEPINWQLSYELFKGQYALTCDPDFPIMMRISEETFNAMKAALRMQAEKPKYFYEFEKYPRLRNSVETLAIHAKGLTQYQWQEHIYAIEQALTQYKEGV